MGVPHEVDDESIQFPATPNFFSMPFILCHDLTLSDVCKSWYWHKYLC